MVALRQKPVAGFQLAATTRQWRIRFLMAAAFYIAASKCRTQWRNKWGGERRGWRHVQEKLAGEKPRWQKKQGGERRRRRHGQERPTGEKPR